MEEAIKNYLKQSFLSLIPRGHRRRQRVAPSRAASAPAMSITRLRSGMPPARPESAVRTDATSQVHASTQAPRPVTAQSNGMRRRRTHAGYARPGYLAPSLQSAGISPPMFRIG